MRKDQKVRLFKVGVCLGRVDGERMLENLRSGPWIVKVASFSVHHYRQFPNKDSALEVQMSVELLRCIIFPLMNNIRSEC